MMFNSPLSFCPVCKDYVALDQTQRECALEHRCAAQTKCPLRALFVRNHRSAQPALVRASEPVH
jgi:hypothetical protein